MPDSVSKTHADILATGTRVLRTEGEALLTFAETLPDSFAEAVETILASKGRVILSGATQAAGARPDIYMALKGTVEEPTRSVDVSALTGWLTLRSVDNEARKLKAAEDAAAKARAAEEATRKRAADEAAAKALAAAESANAIFPPVSPSPLLMTPAPALPPPVSVEALPRPAAPAVR